MFAIATGRNSMNKTSLDPAKPIGNVTIVKDFLPPVKQLVPKQKTVTITSDLTICL